MEHKSVKFNEFNVKCDNWDNYIDRLQYCFEANGIITDTAQRANFFTVCGAQVFETLLALITPRNSSDVTFCEIKSILTKHYSPKPNEISMSYKFYKRDQGQSETASDYIAQYKNVVVGEPYFGDDIIEVPCPEKWAELLGLPTDYEAKSSGGKISKKKSYGNGPYNRAEELYVA